MENENNKSGFLVKLFGLLFTLLTLPFRFFAANPKVFLVFLLILSSIGGTLYFVRNNPQILGFQSQVVDETQKENEKLIEEVGEIIALPQGEMPTIATVSDIEAVNDQTFFANAQNGDKVLIYSTVKKAYLYRPSEKKIIEVGVVNISQDQNNDNEDGGNLEEAVSATPGLSKETIIPTPSITPITTQDITPTENL